MNNLVKKKINALTKGKKKGFTLVELIIVIAIIAILAAIAIPKFGQITRNANIRTDQANAKNIQQAAAQAIAENPALSTGGAALDTAVAGRLDGNRFPTPRAEGTAFTLAVNGNGDITVSVGTEEVYPNTAATYGQQ